MTRFRVWLALGLVRLALWITPKERGDGKMIYRFATSLLANLS